MGQLTASYETYERPGLVMAYKLAQVKIWKGAMVGVDATGYLRPMNPATANLKFVGMANETVDNSTGNAGDKSLNVTKTGSFVLKAASGYTPAITELGKEAYAASDWETNSSSTGLTNAYKIGTVVGVETGSAGGTGVRVRIDNYTV
jgi:hypothetical protein